MSPNRRSRNAEGPETGPRDRGLPARTAVIFGAGQIGRGFIGDICSAEGYRLVFIDVNDRLISDLNAAGSYPLWLLGETRTEKRIGNLKALSLSNIKEAAAAVASTSLVFTAVGASNIEQIVPCLALGIEEKLRGQRDCVLNIVICENLLNAAALLGSRLKERVPSVLHEEMERRVGLVETVVSRMVAPLPEQLRASRPLLVTVEEYNILPVHRPAFRGDVPAIHAFCPVDSIFPHEELKLFVHNLGHAALAYLGYLQGHLYVWEAMEDPETRSVLERVYGETGPALVRKHRFPPSDVDAYISDLKRRFCNRLLGDTVHRVGRDPIRKLGPHDRIIGGLNLCRSQSIPPTAVCLVAAACLCYNYALDPAAVELQARIRTEGIDAVLRDLCGLVPGTSDFERVRSEYSRLKNAPVRKARSIPG